MSDDDGRVARMKDMLSKGGGAGMPGLLPPKPRPKPKAKPKPVIATPPRDTPPRDTTDGENKSPISPDSHMVCVLLVHTRWLVASRVAQIQFTVERLADSLQWQNLKSSKHHCLGCHILFNFLPKGI